MSHTAAYCAACRTYVFVGDAGDCQHGHARSSLRGLYDARTDRKTGRPRPPALSEGTRAGERVAKGKPVEGASVPAGFALAGVPASASSAVPGSFSVNPEPRALPVVGTLAENVDRLLGPPRGRHTAPSLEEPGVLARFMLSDRQRRLATFALVIVAAGALVGGGIAVAASGDASGVQIPASLTLVP